MSRTFIKQFSEPGVLRDPTLGIFFAWGPTLPADGTPGYAVGGLFVAQAGAAGTQLYINENTLASSAFKAVSSTASGAAFTQRVTTTDGVASGTARVVGGLAYSNTVVSSSVGSTSAETVFDTNYTIPANTLKAGTKVRVRYAGFGVTGIGTDTFGHKLYIGGSGGTALITSATAQLATNATFTGEEDIICRTAGAGGTFVGFGTYKQSSAEGTMTVKDDIQRSTSINTTVAQQLVVTGTWNTTNANSAVLDMFSVEIY
jgi:hypothetical protein